MAARTGTDGAPRDPETGEPSHSTDTDENAPRPATSSDNQADPLVGHVVAGRYRVARLVARGGMGRIYLAEQVPLGRAVALKVLDSRTVQRDQDPEFQRRFLLEAATCARLTHPNTVKVFDYGRLDGFGEDTYFMVMEFIEGRTLRQALKEERHFTPVRALRVAREISRSLREAHRAGVVHRDLKPSNVMLVATASEGEAIKVLDFGIAKVLDDDVGDLTAAGKFLGSPRYMAPEVIRHGEVDHRADLYALGVLLYEMLGGKPPFQGEKSVQTMMMHVQDAPRTIRERTGVEVPPEAENIAMRCLQKRPADRPADTDAVIVLIDAALAALGVPQSPLDRPSLLGVPALDDGAPLSAPATAAPVGPDPTQRRVSGRSWLVVVLAVAGVLAAFLLSRGPPTDATGNTMDLEPRAPASLAPTAPQASLVTAPQTLPAAAPAEVPTFFVITVPAGAEVLDGERILGRTPLTLPARPPEGVTARRLTLQLEGFAPQTFEIGAVSPGTIVQRELVRGRPAGVARPRPAPASAPELDIRTTR
jgi:serine/threonine-protein kinase